MNVKFCPHLLLLTLLTVSLTNAFDLSELTRLRTEIAAMSQKSHRASPERNLLALNLSQSMVPSLRHKLSYSAPQNNNETWDSPAERYLRQLGRSEAEPRTLRDLPVLDNSSPAILSVSENISASGSDSLLLDESPSEHALSIVPRFLSAKKKGVDEIVVTNEPATTKASKKLTEFTASSSKLKSKKAKKSKKARKLIDENDKISSLGKSKVKMNSFLSEKTGNFKSISSIITLDSKPLSTNKNKQSIEKENSSAKRKLKSDFNAKNGSNANKIVSSKAQVKKKSDTGKLKENKAKIPKSRQKKKERKLSDGDYLYNDYERGLPNRYSPKLDI